MEIKTQQNRLQYLPAYYTRDSFKDNQINLNLENHFKLLSNAI